MNSLAVQNEGNIGVRVVIKEEGATVSLLYVRQANDELEFSPRGSHYEGVNEVPIDHPFREQARTALLLKGEMVLERV